MMHCGYCNYVAQILMKQVYYETFHGRNNQKKSKHACVQFNKVDEVEKLSMVGTLKNKDHSANELLLVD